MPLIVFCGTPSSGKSTWAKKVADFLETAKQKKVIVVREEDMFRCEEKNDILDDSRKEKELRGKLKSQAQRLLNKEDVVIIDALNYIKGYRYELYCMSKAIPTRQVTVECIAPVDTAWEYNLNRPQVHQYTKPVFDHLIQRFEPPDSNNRWDAPYFSVIAGEELDMEGIYTSLFFNKPPKPNLSTVTKPLSGSSFVSSLEKITSEIIQALITEQKKHTEKEEIHVPHSTIAVVFNQSESSIQTLNLPQLNRFKRQFITMSKAGSVEGEIGDVFVQYLNSQFASTNNS